LPLQKFTKTPITGEFWGFAESIGVRLDGSLSSAPGVIKVVDLKEEVMGQ